jgi:NADP-dependent 3-hydroxy acid dehydrogenase YdfG
MTDIPYRTALIVGAGSGISASVARSLASAGLTARNIDKLTSLAVETGAQTFAVDASQPAAVARLFEDADTRLGEPAVVVYNASARTHGPIAELVPEAVRRARPASGATIRPALRGAKVKFKRGWSWGARR